MARGSMMMGVVGLIALVTVTPVQAQRQAVEQAQAFTRQAMEAYQAADYPAYREHLRQALQHRPSHPGLTYRLAGAYALTNNPDEALTWLHRYAAMGLTAAPEDDDDFATLHDAAAFDTLVARLDQNAQPTGRAEVAFQLDDPAFIPEGIAFDPVTGAFFVASVHRRRIVGVDSSGAVTPFATEEDGLWSVLGLALDAERRRLWAASAALPQTQDVTEEETGRTAVFQFDLDTGALQHVYPGVAGIEGLMGDLAVAPGGTVYVTDARAGALYRIDPKAEAAELFLEAETLISPQGLCFFGPERHLVVADYSLGLVTVDLQTRAVSVIPPPSDGTVLGIDGLSCYEDRVIAVQNGIRPYRVIQFVLNPAATRVEQAAVLVASHPAFEEPTLGTVVGDAFFFVANSQWNRFDEEGRLPPEHELRTPIILKTTLSEAPH